MSYSMYFDPPAALKPLVKLAKGTLTKNLDKAMRALAARAEAG